MFQLLANENIGNDWGSCRGVSNTFKMMWVFSGPYVLCKAFVPGGVSKENGRRLWRRWNYLPQALPIFGTFSKSESRDAHG
mmetsp:Transcript_97707/g.198436  ORF Transcript_97707/g.198436 Transcript_97707/m.198436 type:complete len:81 (+) Transcript_97707:35-277(+)